MGCSPLLVNPTAWQLCASTQITHPFHCRPLGCLMWLVLNTGQSTAEAGYISDIWIHPTPTKWEYLGKGSGICTFKQTLLDILMQVYSSDHTLRNTALGNSLDFNWILTGEDCPDRRKTLRRNGQSRSMLGKGKEPIWQGIRNRCMAKGCKH